MIPKFRVWLPNPDVERMLRVKALVFEHDKTRCVCGYAYDFYLGDEDAILMQSTGLKDKNGKEIFEGDVIAIEVDDTETPINARVFQNSKIGILMFHVFEGNEDVPMVELLEDNSVAFEIIGNIYENPELLEV